MKHRLLLGREVPGQDCRVAALHKPLVMEGSEGVAGQHGIGKVKALKEFCWGERGRERGRGRERETERETERDRETEDAGKEKVMGRAKRERESGGGGASDLDFVVEHVGSALHEADVGLGGVGGLSVGDGVGVLVAELEAVPEEVLADKVDHAVVLNEVVLQGAARIRSLGPRLSWHCSTMSPTVSGRKGKRQRRQRRYRLPRKEMKGSSQWERGRGRPPGEGLQGEDRAVYEGEGGGPKHLERRASEGQAAAGADQLELLGDVGLEVLDHVRLVRHHDVGTRVKKRLRNLQHQQNSAVVP